MTSRHDFQSNKLSTFIYRVFVTIHILAFYNDMLVYYVVMLIR